MTNKLPLVFLSVTLLMAACRKDEAPSTISLEGRWYQQNSTELLYDAQGKLVAQRVVPTPAETPYLVIAATTVEEHANSMVTVYPVHAYTRQQNTLRYSDGTTVEVTQLTANELTLRGPGILITTDGSLTEPPGKAINETHYVR
jgi:hypothetical protein